MKCSAIAVGPVGKAIEFLWGFPSLAAVQASTAHLGKLLTTTHSVFMSALSDHIEDEKPPPHCLLDVRRAAVHNTQWHPFMLSVYKSVKFAWTSIRVSEIQDHVSRVLPILIDEKIHYSIMKMI